MPPEKNTNPATGVPDRWTLIKDMISFQFKLVVDGARDFILVPVSLVVGIISLVKPGDKPGSGFYRLLRTGRSTERWINLFSAADRIDTDNTDLAEDDIDALISRVENFAVNEYRNGELSKRAKEHADQLLKALRSRRQ